MLVVHERELQCSATRFGRTQLLLRRSSVGVGAIGKANSPWRCSQSKLSSVGVKGNSPLGRVDAALTDQLMGEQLTRAAGADAQRATQLIGRKLDGLLGHGRLTGCSSGRITGSSRGSSAGSSHGRSTGSSRGQVDGAARAADRLRVPKLTELLMEEHWIILAGTASF